MRHSTTFAPRQLASYGLLALVAVLSSLLLTRNIDFRVYWYATTGWFGRSLPAYGPSSGLGFPMHYRYSPVTYLLLWPVSRMSLSGAGVLWMAGAWAAASAAVILAVHTAGLRFTRTSLVAAGAFLLGYVVLAVRYGNVQPYLIAMILAALCLSESHPVAAASLMAVAISFKVWPVFFLPWFLRAGRRAVLVWILPALAVLWLAPLVVWSPSHYLDLIRQWVNSEVLSATANSELWYFPGQSLRGILLRYLTPLDPSIKGFPDVHVLSLAPQIVVRTWEAIASAGYVAACIVMLRSDPRNRGIWDGMAFVLFTLLQPFCLKSSMISLGPAAMMAASLYSETLRDRAPRRLFLAACALAFLGTALQYKPWLYLLLTVGVDFFAALLLLAALWLWAAQARGSS